ncbi:hypothetical protein D5085_02120 [Ectothiorhodospiraceae bacterium BW-2]|nr:hypothetical protein D5085_02120 [Ectothiorhodospiraceae bacterium BW-2]
MNSDIYAVYESMGHIFDEGKVNISSFGFGLNVLVPRLDYFFSAKSRVLNKSYKSIIDSSLKDGLKKIMNIYYEQGRLDRAGHTVNLFSYYCHFPNSKVNYYWIPKNACTYLKNVFILNECEGVDVDIPSWRFHETVQEKWGYTLKEYLNNKDKNQPSDCLNVSVIRDPIERFVSCYLDKIAKPVIYDRPFEPFIENIIHSFYNKKIIKRRFDRGISFSEFLLSVINTPSYALNEHWRPQADFLIGIELQHLVLQSQIFEWLQGMEYNISQSEINNKSLGKVYTKNACSGEFFDLDPKKIQFDKIDDYSQFVPDYVENILLEFYSEDYQLMSDFGLV